MKNMHWLLLISGLGLTLSGPLACRTAVPTGLPELIRFERTACMGPCPVDILTIYTNGQMRYEGRAHGPRTGIYTGSLSAQERAALVNQFEAARFFDFAAEYSSPASDLPTYYLTYARAGRSHRVTDYAGAPPRLKTLEAALEKLVAARRWRQAKPKRP